MLIVITGFPRAGTSIMAYMLGMHESITIAIDGPRKHRLENTVLHNSGCSDTKRLNQLLSITEPKHLLLKSPCFCDSDNLKSKYIVMRRNRDELIQSWRRYDDMNKTPYDFNADDMYTRLDNSFSKIKGGININIDYGIDIAHEKIFDYLQIKQRNSTDCRQKFSEHHYSQILKYGSPIVDGRIK